MAGIEGGRRITTHEASVKTATVEVKALTIGGKQVTLSVFRQLKKEELIDRQTAQLRGVPWGTINYFWGKCYPDSAHLHVVWQKGDELRRACVYPGAPWDDSFLERSEVRLSGLARRYVAWRIVRGDEGYRAARDYYGSEVPVAVRCPVVHGYEARATLERWATDVYRYGTQDRPEPRRATLSGSDIWPARPQWEEDLERSCAGFLEECAREHWAGPEHVWDTMAEIVVRMGAFETLWGQQYVACAALDQLFIAV